MTERTTYSYPPRLFSIAEAARYLGVSINTFRLWGIVPIEQGRRVLYDRVSLDLFADRLSGRPLDRDEHRAAAADVEEAFLRKRRRG